ncbi:MAG: hypothetical protein NZL83_04680 [Candidatus Absconditabacterales bacterium]|nr:hypothetical protein [Candidatus Absconditabacterales bacterium]
MALKSDGQKPDIQQLPQTEQTTQTNKPTESNAAKTETAKTATTPFLGNFTGNITQDCKALGSFLTGLNYVGNYGPRLSVILAFDAAHKIMGIKYIIDGKTQSVMINTVTHTTMTAPQVLELMEKGTTTVFYDSSSQILTISTITPKKPTYHPPKTKKTQSKPQGKSHIRLPHKKQ